jgi:hypothetical protein
VSPHQLQMATPSMSSRYIHSAAMPLSNIPLKLPKPVTVKSIQPQSTTTVSIATKPVFAQTGNALVDTVNKIKEYIWDHKSEFVQQFLEVLELNKFKLEERINILLSLLATVMSAKADAVMIAIILDRWGNSQDIGDYEAVISDLAGLVYFPPKCLSYILTTMKELSIEEILQEAIKADISVAQPPAFSLIADRVISSCGRKLKMEEMERLLAAAVNHKREDAIKYLQGHIREQEVEVAASPEWLQYNPKLHTEKTVKECVDFYTKCDNYNTLNNYKIFTDHVHKYVRFNMDKPILYTDKVKAAKARQHASKSVEDRIAAAVNPDGKSSTDDVGCGDENCHDENCSHDEECSTESGNSNQHTENEDSEFTEDIITPKMLLHDYFVMSTTIQRRMLFHQINCPHKTDVTTPCPHDHYPERKLLNPDMLFGLTNSIIDNECLTSLPGGCRMLTCCCRDNEEDFESESTTSTPKHPQSWFTGFCDTCSVKIQHYSCCVRFPVTDGGWIGTYCSIKCIFELPPRPLYRIDTYRLQLITEQVKQVGMIDTSKIVGM